MQALYAFQTKKHTSYLKLNINYKNKSYVKFTSWNYFKIFISFPVTRDFSLCSSMYHHPYPPYWLLYFSLLFLPLQSWYSITVCKRKTGLPWWLRQYRVCLQCERPGFSPWVMKIPWRRKWQPTPMLLPGKSHGWRSLEGYSPWDCKQTRLSNWHIYFLPF